MKTTIVTTYQKNVPVAIVNAWAEVVNTFLPRGWFVEAVPYTPKVDDVSPHGTILNKWLKTTNTDCVVVMDVDCIPLNMDAFLRLQMHHIDALVGCAQRANHLDNNYHVYAAPCCMAFAMETYEKYGRPTFCKGNYWDVGEMLTFVWQRKGEEVALLYSTSCEVPKWSLNEDFAQRYGLGTTYSGLFYHAFNITNPESQTRFMAKCKAIMEGQV
jgi:hypothetical protein